MRRRLVSLFVLDEEKMEPIAEGSTTSVPEVSERTTKGRLFSWSLLGLGEESSPKIWNSRLSWRIVLAVFLTIMAVQASLLALTLKNYQQEQLDELRQSAQGIIAPLVSARNVAPLTSPIDEASQIQVLSLT